MDALGLRADAAASAALAAPEAPHPTSKAGAIRQVEVEFLTQLLAVLRKTVPESDWLPKSPEREILSGAFDRNVAEVLASQDALGMARALEDGAPKGASGTPTGRLKVATETAETRSGAPLQGGRHEDRR
jgi:hypothetical protein